MGRHFSQRPSQLLQIEDEKLALDFDLACTTRLQIYDNELEKIRLEAMTMGAISSILKPQLEVTQGKEGTF